MVVKKKRQGGQGIEGGRRGRGGRLICIKLNCYLVENILRLCHTRIWGRGGRRLGLGLQGGGG